ncbi:SH3 domain-binding protein 2-like isoform X1 [Pomacea canaliculata]|uniref:SH3 domain-binding protein 2-like isoform X1 n=2 Tax=Pomacea canaliculata TaxID=400727 RepID=UPI000D7396E0|nr:SH3 domain-binding protein 2-like isoform X1 [Pomacea canaliculata]XP_025094590.1 SH3 domain-binding protein 2-like isoform X1 [Pomacea canaliculata]
MATTGINVFKVFRAGEVTSKEATWVFKITHVSPEFRTYMFSCSSEREMKHWMKFFKQEMLRANGKLARTQGDGICADQDSRSDSSVNSQDYIDIETNIYEDSKTYIAPSRDLNKREDEESDEEMDNVIKRCLRDPRDRPPLPPPVPDRTTKMARDKNNAPSSAVGSFQVNQLI